MLPDQKHTAARYLRRLASALDLERLAARAAIAPHVRQLEQLAGELDADAAQQEAREQDARHENDDPHHMTQEEYLHDTRNRYEYDE